MEALMGLFAAGGAGATAVGTGAVAAGGVSGLTLLQGGMAAVSAIGSIGAGIAANKEAKAMAAQQEFQARDEQIDTITEQTKIKKAYADSLSKQAVQFAAGGVDLGSGSVDAARRQLSEDAENEIQNAGSSGIRRSLSRRVQANIYRQKGKSALMSGFFDALGTGLNFGISAYKNANGLTAKTSEG
ncbi:MAG: hypothetical protein H6Q99_323 [Proteobacteria bacterium]|nr:hypothetical protein [Pseudomonadota bacterium]